MTRIGLARWSDFDMNSPYQTPPDESPPEPTANGADHRQIRWGVMIALTFGAYFVATIVSPDDPLSQLAAAVPIAALAFLGYYLGLIARST